MVVDKKNVETHLKNKNMKIK